MYVAVDRNSVELIAIDTGGAARTASPLGSGAHAVPLERASTATLEAIRLNLHQGLRLVLAHRDAGTLHQVGPKGAAPPIESGALTLSLLIAIDEELAYRTQHGMASGGDR